MMQPPIILLKEGTDTSQGKAQLLSNIGACLAVVDVVRTTLGPRGMDKLIHEQNGKVTISNDGATIMKLLDIVHPAAATLVDIAGSQDAEVGDGTTSVVLIAGEVLKNVKPFIEDGVHPQVVVKALRLAAELAVAKIKEISVKMEDKTAEERRDILQKCAGTSMNSKLISHCKPMFSKMVVEAMEYLDERLDLNMIGIKKVTGGSLEDSFLVNGVAFEKTFSYAGFEQLPKHIENPKIVLLNVELELKKERDNAEIRIDDPKKYQDMIDAEWNIIYEKLDNIIKAGANVVLSCQAVGDLATQYFADRNVFVAGRVEVGDLRRMSKALGVGVSSTCTDLASNTVGTCDLFEERQVGKERYNVFSGCPNAKTATVVLRGGAEQFIEEADRSLHDAFCVVRSAMRSSAVVAGGGAIEMEVSRTLRDYARKIHGKQQLLINAYAKALEVIPKQIADNAGFDSTDVLNKLRHKHYSKDADAKWYGVDINKEDICDTFEAFVWEPASVKINALRAATEAACIVLSVDETVKNPQSEKPNAQAHAQAAQAMRGRGGMGGMGGMRGMPGVRHFRGRSGK